MHDARGVHDPDLVELSRQAFDAANRHDLDAAMSVFGPDAVWKTAGLGSFYQGVAAIRGGYEAMIGAFDEFRSRLRKSSTWAAA